MTNADNDNDDFPFQSLAAITAKLIRSPENKNDDGADDRRGSERNERDSREHREYVERRLLDFAEFERRARGGK